ncbi:hypothetical protein ACFW3E_39040, partial [Streptomyces sp. NPDC058861]
MTDVTDVTDVTAPGDAWRTMPPVRRVLGAPRTVAEHGFAASLATHWDPSFRTALGHGALPDAPAGVLLDAARPVPPSNGEPPGLRLPVAGGAGGTAAPRPADGLGGTAAPRTAAAPQGGSGNAGATETGAAAARRPDPAGRAGEPPAPRTASAPSGGSGNAGATEAGAAAARRPDPAGRAGEPPAPRTRAGDAVGTGRGTATAGSPPAVQRTAVPAGRDGTTAAPVRGGGASGPTPPVRRAVTSTSGAAATVVTPLEPVRRSPLVSARPVQPPRRLAPAGAAGP